MTLKDVLAAEAARFVAELVYLTDTRKCEKNVAGSSKEAIYTV